MSVFRRKLAEYRADSRGRRWLFIPCDQLSDSIGPLVREDLKTLGIVLVENPWKAARRPYHKQKLALILANLRHFALEQAARGVAVRYLVTHGPYRKALEPLVSESGTMRMMAPAERELRADLQPLVDAGGLELIPHEGWLTTHDEFRAGTGEGLPWRMDAFYRYVRRKTGILMEGAKPTGGKYSFDRENRLPWRGNPRPPAPPTFPLDPIKEEVGRLIESKFGAHPGRLDLSSLPATARDADVLWSWPKRECLPTFDPKANCPFTNLYWAFLSRHAAMLENNPRLRMPMVSLGKRPVGQRHSDESVFRAVGESLLRGDVMRPEKLPKLEV